MASTSSEHGGESSEALLPPMVSGDQRLMTYGGLTKKAKRERGCTAKERISKMPPCTAGKRSSIYRGVTRHRWTGRYEAHLWDKSTWNQNQNKKGKQVYLGAYDDEEAAARAYDLAALKYWGPGTLINFPVTDYTRDLEEMQNVSREDYLASLRRKSSGFARGISKYRPLSRWESQFGHSPGPLNGDETASGSEYAGHFSAERKIDLSNYIKWWGQQHKSTPSDLRSRILDEGKLVSPDDVATELRALESSIKPTEPYEMPRLGTPIKQVKDKKISAMSILEKSAAYKSLQERTAKKKDKEEDNEDENKDNIDKVDNLGKSIDQSCDTERFQRLGATFGVSEGLSSIQTNVYPLGPLLSSPLLTSYNSLDPLTDPVLWNSLAPVYPGGPSRTNEVMKVESSSDHAFFQQGDQHYAHLISDVKTKSDHTQSGLGE